MELRYLLFAGNDYYPAGGWKDFQGAFISKTEALEVMDAMGYTVDWWHIVDRETLVRV